MADVEIGTMVEMKQPAMRQPKRICFDNGWSMVEGKIGVVVAREACSCSECNNAGIWHKILVVGEMVWARRRHFRILLLGGDHG